MPNQFLTIALVTNEALAVLVNNLVFTKNVNRKYDSYFGVSGAKIGAQLTVRKPPRFVGRRGQGLSVEGINEPGVQVTLNNQYGCDVEVSTADMLLSIDEFSDRILKPQVATVANMIDFDGTGQYVNIPDFVGTPGTVPGTSANTAALTYLQAGVSLDNNACPMDGFRSLYITPQMQAYAVNDLKGLFQSATKLKEQYEKGQMGEALGFDWYMDQNIRTHTIGAWAGSGLTNAVAPQTGAQLITDTWTASVSSFVVGDIFTIGTTASTSVYKVNPQSRQATNQLQPFVVTSPVTSDGAGNITFNIYPSIIVGGQFATVNQAAVDEAAITPFGAASTLTPQGLACHRDAFTFASADLPLPNGVHAAYRISDDESGISIRAIQAYDIQTDQMPLRLDVLGGWATLRAELACRVAS